MTVALVAVAMALLTAALLLEDWHWQRKHAQPTADLPAVRGRCLCCPGAPLVDDIFTHSRLAHSPRAASIEDSREWSTR